jgi:HSP20 family protein
MTTEAIIPKKESCVTVPEEVSRFSSPYYEVAQDEAGFDVKVNLPGVAKGASKIYLQDGLLTVEGVRSRKESSHWRLLRGESSTDDFRLRLRLNVDVNEEGITAESKNGVLNIRLPIAEAVKPRNIKIE